VVLEISDDGPGIAADRLAGLLAAPAGPGGIPRNGLAVCRSLLRANGAELEVETAPDRGLTARIVFPAARCLNPV
jgi:signal transduction histidine kinase